MGATLDAKGLNCPMPLIRTRLALKDVAIGETLKVMATDPTSYIDIRLFCETTGQELVSAGEEDGVYTYVICKAAEF
ncbi:MAG: preprotein translocase subunit TatC [Alphaproteobacteria bacterium]|nr:preprotein translocase subunit TatC [Alphaproteobacteria bacterium]|tara:strand:- start:1236 stop:1466 length:231 start_codon:yes stop_codon:yes gene_type:complete